MDHYIGVPHIAAARGTSSRTAPAPEGGHLKYQSDLASSANTFQARSVLGGTALALAIALVSIIVPTGIISPLFVAFAVGMVTSAVWGVRPVFRPGIRFSSKVLLRLGIVLLGLQVSMADVLHVGWAGLVVIVTTLLATFVATKQLARLIGVDARLAELIAVGTSVCGASAIVATNTVTRGSEEDTAYAIACITLFGTLAMLALPFAAGLLKLQPTTYGLWAGATTHEVAQAVAAAFQGGNDAGQLGTIAKLGRVVMLAPLILVLGFFRRSTITDTGEVTGGAPVPWFVLGFLGLVGFNSLVTLPAEIHTIAAWTSTLLLVSALSAMGLETDIGKLRSKGLKPLALGAMSWLFIAIFGLTLILLFGL